MSIVGPDGKEIDFTKLNAKPRKYEVESIKLVTEETPEHMLATALDGARKMAVMQTVQQVVANGGTQQDGIVRGQTVASKIVSPFQMEPAAGAAFMLLSREIAKRDMIIKELYASINEMRAEMDMPDIDPPTEKELEAVAAPEMG